MKKLIPVEDHVLIKPVAEDTTASGLHTGDNDPEKPSKGIVIAVGIGKQLENWSMSIMQIKEWDTVYFEHYVAKKVDVDGERFFLARQHDITAILA